MVNMKSIKTTALPRLHLRLNSRPSKTLSLIYLPTRALTTVFINPSLSITASYHKNYSTKTTKSQNIFTNYTMPSTQPRIAIIGGGPGGLTLGALLHQRNIPFTIYELRPRPTDADLSEPSAMLDLHPESGIAAIRACGLYEKFLPYTADCEESMIIRDKMGTSLHEDRGELSERPEIARNNITRLMLSVLSDEGAIRYDSKLLSASRDETTGEVTLEISTKGQTATETYDLVVGADGAWSRIRPLLSATKPQLSGTNYIQLYAKNISTRYPSIAELVGKGTMTALGGSNGLGSQRGTQDAMQLYVFISTAAAGEEGLEALKSLSIPEQKERLLTDERLFGTYGEPLKEMIRVAFDDESAARGKDERLEVRPLVLLPIGHTWEHKPGVTLIGDAAHVMLPFAGEGVNMAMLDALNLSEVIIKAFETVRVGGGGEDFQGAVNPLIREFEGIMLKRANQSSQEAWDNGQLMMGEDAAEKMATIMATIHQHGLPEGVDGSMSLDEMYQKSKEQHRH